MKIGLWQLLIWIVLVLFFFGPALLAVLRFIARVRGGGEKGGARRRSLRRGPAFACPRCHADLPDDAEYCPRCGRHVGVIDVSGED